MSTNKEKILEFYFNKKMKQVDIARILSISANAVSKTLKRDSRFEKEKKHRKEVNKIKHNKMIQKSIEEKRKRVALDKSIDILILKEMHNQASFELSGGNKPINNVSYRNWNKSAYKFDRNKKAYILKKEINAGYDVPKKIIWK